MTTHWAARSAHWGLQGVPLKPNQEVIDFLTSTVSPDANILLLGVTPQIADAFNRVVAVDYSDTMIQRIWPGNTETKTVILDNWLIYHPSTKFDAVIGDGSLNMLRWPDQIQTFFSRLSSLMKSDGIFVCRMFTRWDTPVTIDQINDELRTNSNFAAWRRLLNMYLANHVGPNVRHADALNLFNTLYPDRSKLPWSPEQCAVMDAYRDTTTSTWFPTRRECLEHIPSNIDAQFIDVGTYTHSTAYPILLCKIQDQK